MTTPKAGVFDHVISRLKEILADEEKTAYYDQSSGWDTAAEDHRVFAWEIRHAIAVLRAAQRFGRDESIPNAARLTKAIKRVMQVKP